MALVACRLSVEPSEQGEHYWDHDYRDHDEQFPARPSAFRVDGVAPRSPGQQLSFRACFAQEVVELHSSPPNSTANRCRAWCSVALTVPAAISSASAIEPIDRSLK